MPSTQLTQFTQPAILKSLGATRLLRFLDGFRQDLITSASPIGLLSPQPQYDDFVVALAALLVSPPAIPERMLAALLALEKIAAPEHQHELHAEIARQMPGFSFPEGTPSLAVALELWFLSPEHVLQLAGSLPSSPEAEESPSSASPLQGGPDSTAIDITAVSRGVLDSPPSPKPVPTKVALKKKAGKRRPPSRSARNSTAAKPGAGFPPVTSDTDTGPETSDSNSQHLGEPKPGEGCSSINSQPPVPSRHKIARLPESVKDSINQMLHDHLPYALILQQLGTIGKNLNKDNLSRWKKNGHQDWVKEHQRRADVRTKLQFALDIVRENENSKIHEASQQMAALQVCELLTDFDPAALKQTLQDDPSGYVRLLNALPKLSKGGLACERLRVELAERKAKLEKEKIPRRQRGISAKALRLAEAKLNLM